jgi:short-subunit dehydrogenase
VGTPVALVVGASAGVGEAFARALAGRGHDLVRVARRAERPQELAGRVKAEHGRSAEVLTADLETDGGMRTVEDRLADAARPVEAREDRRVRHPRPFPRDAARQRGGRAPPHGARLRAAHHAALTGMVERGHGGVINVSSVGAYQPTPFSATYSATKAFV